MNSHSSFGRFNIQTLFFTESNNFGYFIDNSIINICTVINEHYIFTMSNAESFRNLGSHTETTGSRNNYQFRFFTNCSLTSINNTHTKTQTFLKVFHFSFNLNVNNISHTTVLFNNNFSSLFMLLNFSNINNIFITQINTLHSL